MFTEEELSKVLSYLSYPKQNYAASATSYGLHVNSPSLDYLYTSLQRISPEGEARVREDLCDLRQVDDELRKLRAKATVEGTGDVKLNVVAGRRLLLGERRRLVLKLADDLGAPPNPFAHAGGPRVTNT